MAVSVRELELEGVGLFREPRRFVLRQGLCVVLGGNESGKSTLLGWLAALLDPAADLEPLALRRSIPPGERARLRARIERPDESLEIEIDLQARRARLREGRPGGSVAIHDLGPALADDLRDRIGAPAVGAYSLLFTTAAERVATMPAPSPGVSGSRGSTLLRIRAARAERDALGAQLELVRGRRARAEARVGDEVHLRELEEIERQAAGRSSRIEGLDEEIARAAPLAEAAADVADWAEEYGDLEAQLASNEQALAERSQTLERVMPGLARGSGWRWAAIATGTALGAAALAAPTLSTGLLVGLGGAALLLGGVGLVAEIRVRLAVHRVQTARSEAEDRARMLRRRFELETAASRRLGAALGLGSPLELPAALASLRSLEAERDRERDAGAALGDPETRQRELERLRARREAAPHEPAPDPAREAALEAAFAGAEHAFEQVRAEAAGEGLDAVTSLAGERIETLLEAAQSLVGRPREMLWREAEPVAAGYLRALAAGRYVAVRRKAAGDYLLEREAGSPIPLGHVGGTAAEVVHHSVQFALVERVALQLPLPVLLDDPFVRLDPARRKGAASALRRLSAVTQVVFATSDPRFEEIAEGIVRL